MQDSVSFHVYGATKCGLVWFRRVELPSHILSAPNLDSELEAVAQKLSKEVDLEQETETTKVQFRQVKPDQLLERLAAEPFHVREHHRKRREQRLKEEATRINQQPRQAGPDLIA